MNFLLSPEQESIRRAADEFAKGEFKREIALEHELNHRFPIDLLRKAASLGFIGIHYPEKYGGQGYGLLENVLVTEAFCKQDSGLGIALTNADVASSPILLFGKEEHKEKYLPLLATGKAISSIAFTEPDHGSDITCLTTQAIKRNGEYIINGVKIFITNGPISDFFVVLCQTDMEVSPSYRGQSMILVEKGMKGFTVTECGEKMGNKMVPTGELAFSDVRVPASFIVGEENRGFYQAMRVLEEIRIRIAGQALGIAQGAFERTVSYLKSRRQFGKRLGEFQVLRHRLAKMKVKIETARLLVYKAAWVHDMKLPDEGISAMAKSYASRVAHEVVDEAIQMHGGYGYMLEYDLERFYRDARLLEIYGGTTEIQNEKIAKGILGEY
ncbi:MAG: acyl-CoA dehydrogenase family protein [candidate division WOR-3 bacterium]